MKKLILYTKPGCHLCDEMKEALLRFKKTNLFDLEEIDISTDKNHFERYKEKIPVLLVNNKIFAKFRLDESRLERILKIK